jgi:hypothetical protein
VTLTLILSQRERAQLFPLPFGERVRVRGQILCNQKVYGSKLLLNRLIESTLIINEENECAAIKYVLG